MDWSSFSHGQIQSKLWLCEEIEPYISYGSNIAILGSWYNILGFMLLVRKPMHYNQVTGIDKDFFATTIANKITNAWQTNEHQCVRNETHLAEHTDLTKFNVVINTSPEHMNNNIWYENCPNDSLVCIQSSDIQIANDDVWKCVNPNATLDELVVKYSMSTVLYSGMRYFDYGSLSYKRFMVIGYK